MAVHASDLPSPLVGENGAKLTEFAFANSVGMRGISTRSKLLCGGENPSPWKFAERKFPVPLPQGARVKLVRGKAQRP